MVGAALEAGARPVVSCADTPGEAIVGALRDLGVEVRTADADWLEDLHVPRVRLIGEERGSVAEVLGPRPDVALYGQPVTESGRLEALPFLLEQALSITNHRFGTLRPMSEHPGHPYWSAGSPNR